MTSNPGAASGARVAADANVILSALCGKAALKVFTGSSLEVITARKTFLEVQEYLPVLAARYGMLPELLEGQLGLLAIQVFEARRYRRKLREAARRIADRDPDDVDLLALALSEDIPIWSNDNDFSRSGVEWYTTARLLKQLGIQG